MASTLIGPKEKRIIIVEGELLTVQRIVIEREVKTSEFIEELCKSRMLVTEILPNNCVLYSRFSEASGSCLSMYVIELPPRILKAIYKRNPINADEERHPERCIRELALSWPGTLWFIRFKNSGLTDVYLAAILEPVTNKGMDTPIFYLPMPNQYDYGVKGFCTGNIGVDVGLPFAQKVNAIMEQLLTSMWNEDLQVDYQDSGVLNLFDWHDKTTGSPDFWKKMKFHSLGKWKDLKSIMLSFGFPG